MSSHNTYTLFNNYVLSFMAEPYIQPIFEVSTSNFYDSIVYYSVSFRK